VSGTWIEQWKRERRAGTPLVALATPDVPAAATAVASGAPAETPVIVWSTSQGARAGNANPASQDALSKLSEALNGIDPASVSNMGDLLVGARALPERTVLVTWNAHLHWTEKFVRDAALALRDLFKQDQRTLLLLAPDVADLAREIGPDTRVLREGMPDRAARAALVTATYGSATGVPDLTDQARDRATEATAGLTAFAVEQAVAVNIRKEGLDVDGLRTTAREAVNARRGLRVSDERITYRDVGGLAALADYVRALFRGPDRPSAVVLLDEIEKMLAGSGGGDLSGVSSDILGALLTWMERRKVHATLLMGPPGSGKSLSAQAAAGEHDVPLLWCDIGAMKGSLVGESGANLRAALDTIDAVSEGRVLLVATCNGVRELRPELLRRFKPRFMVDLPLPEDVEGIWRIQLAANGLTESVARPPTDGWTGAEVRDACRIARATATTPKDAARYIVPISVSSKPIIDAIRNEAQGKFICASRGGPYRGPDALRAAAPPSTKRRSVSVEEK
jgi:hypothetical protein